MSEQYKTVQTAEEGGGLRRLPPRLDRKCTPVARAPPPAAVCPLRRPAWPACHVAAAA